MQLILFIFWGNKIIYWCLVEDVLKSLRTLYKESKEFEVADVHLNVTWAQPAEKKSQLPGF